MIEPITATSMIDLPTTRQAFYWRHRASAASRKFGFGLVSDSIGKWLITICFLLMLGVGCTVSDYSKSSWLGTAMFGTFTVGLWWGNPVFGMIMERRIKALPTYLKQIDWRFDDLGLEAKIEQSISTVEWGHIYEIVATPAGALIFYAKNGIANWLPKEAFVSPADYAAFLMLTASKTKRRVIKK